MTSEVLMLNKDAVVLAADSAVTTGRDPHPRYSKAANKIFDLCVHGNVAVTIYSAAELDGVPWELALKQFRHADKATAQRPKLKDYVDALLAYLQANPALFPPEHLEKQLERRIFNAAAHVLRSVKAINPDVEDAAKTEEERRAAWSQAHAIFSGGLASIAYEGSLTEADHQALSEKLLDFEQLLAPVLSSVPEWTYVNVGELTALALEALLKQPSAFLDYTGTVLAGYGADEIFPSFFHIHIYGHIGGTLFWTPYYEYAITHTNDAWIQPFAQSSMIDRFTDGFDSTLQRIINDQGKACLDRLIGELRKAGHAIPNELADSVTTASHAEFMDAWKKDIWNKTFHPLRRVLNSLSVSEMAHLAESLLVLEELRERVTSPSESVGGPIDVAVITKSEGLIWLKRKHYFPAEINPRYFNRMKGGYN